MKDNKFFKIITSKYVILGIQLIISIVAVYFCFKLKLIPMKYIMGIITSNYFFILHQWKQHSINKDIKFYC